MGSTKFFLAFAILCCLCLSLCAPAQGVIPWNYSLIPQASNEYGSSVPISVHISSDSGKGYWNGTFYVNLTSPSGALSSVASVAYSYLNLAQNRYYNYTPSCYEAGEWNVTAHWEKTNGTLTITDDTRTFHMERMTETQGKLIQNFGVLLFFFVAMGCLIILCLAMVDTMMGASKKK